ncbi:conserved hypothetical protein, partial [Ricinus communis]
MGPCDSEHMAQPSDTFTTPWLQLGLEVTIQIIRTSVDVPQQLRRTEDAGAVRQPHPDEGVLPAPLPQQVADRDVDRRIEVVQQAVGVAPAAGLVAHLGQRDALGQREAGAEAEPGAHGVAPRQTVVAGLDLDVELGAVRAQAALVVQQQAGVGGEIERPAVHPLDQRGAEVDAPDAGVVAGAGRGALQRHHRQEIALGGAPAEQLDVGGAARGAVVGVAAEI